MAQKQAHKTPAARPAPQATEPPQPAQRQATPEETIQALNNMCVALEQQRNQALNQLAAQNIVVEQLKAALQQAQQPKAA